MKTSDIKRVIDAGLADIETTQHDVDAIMEYIRNTEIRKPARKMPLAVAIAMILMLIGAVAFAAMSFLGVIDQIFDIQEEEQVEAIDKWSFEHKMEVVNLLLEHGTDFDEEMLMQLYDDELTEEEKGDLIIEMLKKRFPPTDDYWYVTTLGILLSEKGDIKQWSHADRAWLSEQMNMPFNEVGDVRNVVPTEDDLSEAEAYEIAYQYYEKTYGLSLDCFDTARQYAGFSEGIEEGGVIRRNWFIQLYILSESYNGQELASHDVSIRIYNDGSIYEAMPPKVRTWEDDWSDFRYAGDFWTIETMYAFQTEWKERIEQLIAEDAPVNREMTYLITKEFGLPDSDDIPIEEARSIAEKAIMEMESWSETILAHYGKKEAYYASEPNQYWIVYTLAVLNGSELTEELRERNRNGEIPYGVRVCIDSKTGTIMDTHVFDSGLDIINVIGI